MTLHDVMGMNVAQVIAFYGTGQGTRDRTFLMFRDEGGGIQNVTFRETYEQSLHYAHMIQELKKEQGKADSDRYHVGIFAQNTPEFVYLLGGCAFSNSTLVGINNAQVGEKLASDINKIDIDALFVDEFKQPHTDRTFLETVLDARDRFGFDNLTADHIIARKRQETGHPASISTIADKLRAYAPAFPDFCPSPLDESNAGVIIFTSGTTGVPKGIEVLWKKVFDVGVVSTDILHYTADDISYICMPLNHSNSLYLALMPALLNGAKVMLRRRFSASSFIQDIEESGATIWNCVGDPAQYVLNRTGEDADYSHLPLRTVISTGTNAHNRKAFTRVFGLDIFTEIFGSTEVGAITKVDENTPAYSVGVLLRDIRVVAEEGEDKGKPRELARVDETGRITNSRESAGEIVVSQESLGDSRFAGYYKLPEESKKCVDDQGYYHMGDLGAIVEQEGIKYLVFSGRSGDRIRHKGENFVALDMENVLRHYKGIGLSAAIGIPQAVNTEDDPMIVVEADHERLDVRALYEFCKTELPDYMLPRFIRVVESLPKTDTLKIQKGPLKSAFFERTGEIDADEKDVLYEVRDGTPRLFTSADYRREMDKYRDPNNQQRLLLFTKREDLFGK